MQTFVRDRKREKRIKNFARPIEIKPHLKNLTEDTEIFSQHPKFSQIPKNLAKDRKVVAQPRKIRLDSNKYHWT